MNVSTAGEGAKTKVLLQGLHCVNILAPQEREGGKKWERSLDCLLTKGSGGQGRHFMCRSPLRALAPTNQ